MDITPNIKLVVLDTGGTTVRDDDVSLTAFVEALAAYGAGPDVPGFEDRLTFVRRTMGRARIDVFRVLLGHESRAQAAHQVFEAAIESAVAQGGVEPIPGARGAIEQLREAGIAVCLATGYSQRTLDRIVDGIGWRDLVDGALAPGQGRRGRPHPDLILSAVMEFGIDSVAAVAVAGDSVSDLLAGQRAGASIVAGVLTGIHDREDLARAPHTHLVKGVWDLPGLVLRDAAPLTAA
ncbi:MAG: HAD family hydrolase [Acidimicrobiia bacterium]